MVMTQSCDVRSLRPAGRDGKSAHVPSRDSVGRPQCPVPFTGTGPVNGTLPQTRLRLIDNRYVAVYGAKIVRFGPQGVAMGFAWVLGRVCCLTRWRFAENRREIVGVVLFEFVVWFVCVNMKMIAVKWFILYNILIWRKRFWKSMLEN